MQFYCNGETWDTDKPVYVLGQYVLRWFPLSSQDLPRLNDNALVCKKVYIKTIEIEHDGTQSWVKNFTTTCPSDRMITLSLDRCIIGKSPKRAKKKYKALLEEAVQ